MIEEKINNWLENKFNEEEYKELFLVELNVRANGYKIKVFIDSDTGVSFDECRSVSRYLEENLEKEELVPEQYTIEVSSPGVSRPLTILRQYPKNIGRDLEVKLNNSPKKIEGELIEVGNDSIILSVMPKAKKGVSSKDLKPEEKKLGFDEIKNSKVKISFKK